MGKIIGVIGGVGAGKSTVLAVLEAQFFCRIVRTDDIAKTFYTKGHPVYERLKEMFGEDILSGDHIDLAAFGKILYRAGNENLREQVDQIVHPAVWDFVDAWIREARETGTRIVVETALPNADFIQKCDEVWFVHCDPEVRISRIMKTRGYSREKAVGIIHSQPHDADYAGMADWVIENTGTEEETRNEIYEHCKRLEW